MNDSRINKRTCLARRLIRRGRADDNFHSTDINFCGGTSISPSIIVMSSPSFSDEERVFNVENYQHFEEYSGSDF